jgi:hypothetical protein
VSREGRSPVTSSPLPTKLGIKPGARLALVGAPDGFLESALAPLPDAGDVRPRARWPLDTIVFVTTSRAQLERRFGVLSRALDPAGSLWIAWPKRSSGMKTDLTEDTLRDVILPQGLVDTKVCAIDQTWSGLRFVIRKENR